MGRAYHTRTRRCRGGTRGLRTTVDFSIVGTPPMASTLPARSRLRLFAGLVAVIALGLASRRFPWLFPAFLGKYPGDALWALMVFVGFALFKPRAATSVLALLALGTSCLVELTQLYRAPWLDQIRSTTAGHLVLGSTFSWLDMAAYAVGVAVGSLIDRWLAGAPGVAVRKLLTGRSRGSKPPPPP